MLDIGWAELFVVGVITLVVMGPREIPKVFYEVGKWVRKARAVTREFQRHVDDMVRETELEELRKEANAARNFNLRQQIENSIDPDGDLRQGIRVDGGVSGAQSKRAETALDREAVMSRAHVDDDEPDNPAFRTPTAAPDTAAPDTAAKDGPAESSSSPSDGASKPGPGTLAAANPTQRG